MENNQKICVSLDSCVAFELASYIINVVGVDEFNRPADYWVHEILSNNSYRSREVANKCRVNSITPRILINEYGHGCSIYDAKNGTFPHLEAIAELYDQIVAGNIEVYITKTVLYEIYGAEEQTGWVKPALYNELLDSGIIRIIDDAIITQMSCKLAHLYCKNKIMDQTYDTENDKMIPTKDTYIMAQSSMVGLTLLTWNEKDFIDKKWWRANCIQAINKQCGLLFPSIGSDHQIPPKAITPDQFMGRYRAYSTKRVNPEDYVGKPVVTIPDFDLNRINRAYKIIVEKLQENTATRGF